MSQKYFSLLQIRPIVGKNATVNLKLDNIRLEDTIILSNTALGNGIVKDIRDFIYVKPETFDASKSQEIGRRLEVINERFLAEKKNYVLVGPGSLGFG
jgi:hypothetical protein